MHSSVLENALWLLYSLGTLAVLVALVRSRAPFPSLFALCSVQLLTSSTLFLIRSHYAAYFYTYWASAFLQSGLRLWLLIDVLRSIPGNSFIPRGFRQVVVIAGILIASGSAWVAHSGHVPWAMHLHSKAGWMVDFVLINQQSVTFFCVTFCASLLTAVYLLGLRWSWQGASIACGLGLQLGGAALCSLLFSGDPHYRLTAQYLDGFTDIAVLILWYRGLTPSCSNHLGNRVAIQ
jgi:hypothetical protein